MSSPLILVSNRGPVTFQPDGGVKRGTGGLVTALIGLGGLGQLITYGFTIGYYTPIIVGLVLSVALAAVFDLLVVGVQRLSLPWTRTTRSKRSI